jgi:hypothetical protein
MAYDTSLADRVRRAVADKRGIAEKRMFGGIAFLLDARMFCGVAPSHTHTQQRCKRPRSSS